MLSRHSFNSFVWSVGCRILIGLDGLIVELGVVVWFEICCFVVWVVLWVFGVLITRYGSNLDSRLGLW